jgi:hypothetical protein
MMDMMWNILLVAVLVFGFWGIGVTEGYKQGKRDTEYFYDGLDDWIQDHGVYTPEQREMVVEAIEYYKKSRKGEYHGHDEND